MKTSFLKKILIVLFAIIIILGGAFFVNNDIIKKQPESIQQAIVDKFNKIKVELEYNGLTASIEEMTKDYSDKFDGYSNIIITDDDSNILYNTNGAYISEKNQFRLLVDPWGSDGYGNDTAYLIDSQNNVKYTAHLDICVNPKKLKEESAQNKIAKELFPKNPDDDDFGSRDAKGDSSETRIIINYEYVASKGLNLFSLYDSEHQYDKYYQLENSLRDMSHRLLIATSVFGAIFWILLPIWIFVDAREKYLKAAFWTIVAFALNILGLGLYLMLRPRFIKCRLCGKKLNTDWIVCPYCGDKPDFEETNENILNQ